MVGAFSWCIMGWDDHSFVCECGVVYCYWCCEDLEFGKNLLRPAALSMESIEYARVNAESQLTATQKQRFMLSLSQYQYR
jgi:hypothetical protein